MSHPALRHWRGMVPALLLSAGLGLARLTAAAPLTDPTGHPLPAGLRLATPTLYLVLEPLFSLWDGVSMLSLTRLRGFLWGLALLYLLWRLLVRLRRRGSPGRWLATAGREAAVALLCLGAFAVFLAGGALWHRPMLSLRGVPADRLVFDIHTHSNASHDVRGTLMDGFDAEANRRWHRRAGYDAFFLTDHNTVANLPPLVEGPGAPYPYLCPGTEVSAWRAHLVLLGATREVTRSDYPGSLAGLLALIGDAEPKYGALAIASIPEYERNHRENLAAFVAAGLAGFEVVNAAPKANEIGRARRDSVIELARSHDRLVLGASDSHGWGATNMVWNLIAISGWREAGSPCQRLLYALRTGGFAAVQVVERHRLRPDAWWPNWLTPVGLLWETWRGLDAGQTFAWFGWIWLAAALLGRRPLPRPPADAIIPATQPHT